MKKFIEKGKSIWSKYGKKTLIVIAMLIAAAGLVYAGQWYAKNRADEFAKRLHDKFIAENQSLYESIATLKAQTKILEQKYRQQLKEIEDLKKRNREEIKNVFKSGDKKAIASYFDNTVDGYNPNE